MGMSFQSSSVWPQSRCWERPQLSVLQWPGKNVMHTLVATWEKPEQAEQTRAALGGRCVSNRPRELQDEHKHLAWLHPTQIQVVKWHESLLWQKAVAAMVIRAPDWIPLALKHWEDWATTASHFPRPARSLLRHIQGCIANSRTRCFPVFRATPGQSLWQ